MTNKLLLAMIKERLEVAFAEGDHRAARVAFWEMLKVGKAWLLEIRESPTYSETDQVRRFTKALEALKVTLRRNEELAAFAPFLIGEHVEVEQIKYRPRQVWVEAKILDYRPAENRARLHRSSRALDYLIKDRDGEESWRAVEGIRSKARR